MTLRESAEQRENYAVVYLYPEKNQIILPIRGKGYGPLSGDSSHCPMMILQHGELRSFSTEKLSVSAVKSTTLPGKDQFVNPKQTIGDDGQVILNVTKSGAAGPNDIDGLAGATITTQGVDKLIKFWLGENGFGNYLQSRIDSQRHPPSASN